MLGLGIGVLILEWGKEQLSINSTCTDKSNENICSNSGGKGACESLLEFWAFIGVNEKRSKVGIKC